MNREQKIALVMRHMSCEMSRDWDGALGTMTDDAVYEHFPSGLRLTGREAIVHHWERIVGQTRDPSVLGNARTAFWVTDDSVVLMLESVIATSADEVSRSRSFAVFDFEGDLIRRESTYADPATEDRLASALGSELDRQPGVERVYSTEPSPAADEVVE